MHVIDELRHQVFIPLGSNKFVQVGEVRCSPAMGVRSKVYGC